MKALKVLSSIICALSFATSAMAEKKPVKLEIIKALHVPKMDIDGSDPYIKWTAGNMKGKTRSASMEKDDQAAEWNYTDAFDAAPLKAGDDIKFEMKEEDGRLNIKRIATLGKARVYGSVSVKLSDIKYGETMNLLVNGKNSKDSSGNQTVLVVRFTQVDTDDYADILEARKR